MAKRQWSAGRPVRPEVDPLFLEIVEHLKRDHRTRWEQADRCGLSPATLQKWLYGDVRRPQGVSLQMAARLIGKKVTLS